MRQLAASLPPSLKIKSWEVRDLRIHLRLDIFCWGNPSVCLSNLGSSRLPLPSTRNPSCKVRNPPEIQFQSIPEAHSSKFATFFSPLELPSSSSFWLIFWFCSLGFTFSLAVESWRWGARWRGGLSAVGTSRLPSCSPSLVPSRWWRAASAAAPRDLPRRKLPRPRVGLWTLLWVGPSGKMMLTEAPFQLITRMRTNPISMIRNWRNWVPSFQVSFLEKQLWLIVCSVPPIVHENRKLAKTKFKILKEKSSTIEAVAVSSFHLRIWKGLCRMEEMRNFNKLMLFLCSELRWWKVIVVRLSRNCLVPFWISEFTSFFFRSNLICDLTLILLVWTEMDMMKERFGKLLLGEDMSGSGKGVSTALAISNAITNLCGIFDFRGLSCIFIQRTKVLSFIDVKLYVWLIFAQNLATIFGQLWRLEPLPEEKRTMWRREMEWLLCVSEHIIELIPSWQTFPDGSKLEVLLINYCL